MSYMKDIQIQIWELEAISKKIKELQKKKKEMGKKLKESQNRFKL